MTVRGYWIAYHTLVAKQVRRFLRTWVQTMLPSAVTMVLYLVIFGQLVGQRVGEVAGLPYRSYIVPGLIMMSVITNAYANVVSAFFGAKLQRHIEELLVAPIPHGLILAGFVTAGVIRGLAVGAVVTLIAVILVDLPIHHGGLALAVAGLTAVLFALAGLINGIYAQDFDDTSVVSTFLLTPLTYLGGVFYSVQWLPGVWADVARANPILYIVDGFRYSLLGSADVSLATTFILLISVIVGLAAFAYGLLRRGVGIKP